MTAENRSHIRYLTKADIELIHRSLAEKVVRDGEPIPPFSRANHDDIDALLQAPRQSFFGREAYPTIEEKAAIIFYTINKRQIFLNGNKRMSTACLAVFLLINDHKLVIDSDELTAKALWLANTASLDFPLIKQDLVLWLTEHVRPVVDLTVQPEDSFEEAA